MTTPTRLYRWFDADGTLLYIGISINPSARARQHMDGSAWVARAVRMEVDPIVYQSRIEALAAESDAIRSERPAFNIAGTRPRPQVQALSDLLPLTAPSDAPYAEVHARWVEAVTAKIRAIEADEDDDRAIREARRTAQTLRQYAKDIGGAVADLAACVTEDQGWKAGDVAAALGVSRIRAYQIIAAGRPARTATPADTEEPQP